MGPLAGIRVIDMTSVVMGPFATQILGDFGADIIKVEAPEGDLVRKIGPGRHPGMGALFMNSNRSKRSITLDLKKQAGRNAFLNLCKSADVMVCNVRARAMRRLGLDYDAIKAVNPRIIYAGLYGFDQRGPYADRPAYDDLIQGAATLPYLYQRATGHEPRFVPSAIADRIVALYAVGAITSALVERARTGQGQSVSIPMFETVASVMMADHLGGLTFDPPLDQGGYSRQLSPHRRPYETSDGYICTAIFADQHWERFLVAIGLTDLPSTDPRFRDFQSRYANIDDVNAWLSETFKTRSTQEWLRVLEDADIPVMPMHDFGSIMKDPHLVAIEFFKMMDHPTEGRIRSLSIPAAFSRTPPQPSGHAPRQGEHGEEILLEAGLTPQEIDALRTSNVLLDEK
jgi:crotonobetainyl-CoA:carnitine CoA-transferase CaiB-like acyl-CoA transferase